MKRRSDLLLLGGLLSAGLLAWPGSGRAWAAEETGIPEAATWLDWLHRLVPSWIPVQFFWSVFTILLLTVIAWAGTRRMRRQPKGLQNLLEMAVEGLGRLFVGVMGPAGRGYVPFLATLFIYILAMNLLGLLPGFASPTSNLNTTAALALVVFLATQIHGFRVNGLRYLKHFIGEPWWLCPVMLPVHLLGELARPLSLSVRLFGNIFSEDMVILTLIGMAAGLALPLLPLQFPMLLLALLTSLVQALIFSFLAAIYLFLATGEEHT